MNILKKTSGIIVLILFFNTVLYSAPFNNIAKNITQPNGLAVTVYYSGDERVCRMHDNNNYTIIKNNQTGYYCYAKLVNGMLTPTNYVVGINNPTAYGLLPGINQATAASVAQNSLHPITPVYETSLKTTVSAFINNIVIYVRFSDQDEFPAEQSIYTQMYNAEGSNTNSMYEYFKDVSGNKLEVKTHFFPKNNGVTIKSFKDSHPRNYYRPKSDSNPIGYVYMKNNVKDETEWTNRTIELRNNAVLSLKSEILSSGVNFNSDSDDLYDNVTLIIRGDSEIEDLRLSSLPILWPQYRRIYHFVASNYHFENTNLQCENMLKDPTYGTGALCHEFLHSLGAYDMYHLNDTYRPVGKWSIMATNTNPPQHLTAFEKSLLGTWIDIPEITTAGEYSLKVNQESSSASAYKIAIPGSKEYLVLEYRNKSTYFDSQIPASGLVVAKINPTGFKIEYIDDRYGNVESTGTGGIEDELYIYRPGGSPTSEGDISKAAQVSKSISCATDPYLFTSKGITVPINIDNITLDGNDIRFYVSFRSDLPVVYKDTDVLPVVATASTITTVGQVTVREGKTVLFRPTGSVFFSPGFAILKGGSISIDNSVCK